MIQLWVEWNCINLESLLGINYYSIILHVYLLKLTLHCIFIALKLIDLVQIKLNDLSFLRTFHHSLGSMQQMSPISQHILYVVLHYFKEIIYIYINYT